MEEIRQFLEEPVKVGHLVWLLIISAVLFSARVVTLQNQLNAIGKNTYEVWKRIIHPDWEDD